jgi:hypothetical protein
MYTYKDFEDKAKEYGFTPDQISEADYKLARQNADAGVALLGYKNDWLTATNDSAKAMAHAAAEDIRSRYGNYSGGGDGGSFTPTGTAQYEDPWEQTIQSTVRNLQNKKFDWSPETDPTVKYYEDAYRREGERAMKDVLGAVAATTGGIPSSYATAAAAQQRNYYAQQMADKYPELYKQAFDQFMQEYDREYQMLDAYMRLDDTDYNRWSDQQERDRNTRLDAVDKWYKEQDIGLRGRDLDITENQYGAQNEIAWAELGLKDKDMQQKYDLAYAQLNQDDRHFVDDLLYRYNVMTEEGKQFWAKLAQDGEIADKEIKLEYDKLDQNTKNFLMEYALDVEKLEFEKDVHADEVDLAQQEIDYNWERLREDARQFDISTEQAKIIADMEDQLARDKITASKDAEKLEMATVAASYGDFSALKALGYDVSIYEAIYNKKMAEELDSTTEEELPTEDDIPEDVVDAVAGKNTNSTTTTVNTSDPSFIGPRKTGAEFTNINDIIGKMNAGFELTENEKAILAKNNKGTKESNSEFTDIKDIIAKSMNGYKLTPREQAIFDKYTAKTFTK